MANTINIFGTDEKMVDKYLKSLTPLLIGVGVVNVEEHIDLLGASYNPSSSAIYPTKIIGKQFYAYTSGVINNLAILIGDWEYGVTIADEIRAIKSKLEGTIDPQILLNLITRVFGIGLYNNGINGVPINITKSATDITFTITPIDCILMKNNMPLFKNLGNSLQSIPWTLYAKPDTTITLKYLFRNNFSGDEVLEFIDQLPTNINLPINTYGGEEDLTLILLDINLLNDKDIGNASKYQDFLTKNALIELYDLDIQFDTSSNIKRITFKRLFDLNHSASYSMNLIKNSLSGQSVVLQFPKFKLTESETTDSNIEYQYDPIGTVYDLYFKPVSHALLEMDGSTFYPRKGYEQVYSQTFKEYFNNIDPINERFKINKKINSAGRYLWLKAKNVETMLTIYTDEDKLAEPLALYNDILDVRYEMGTSGKTYDDGENDSYLYICNADMSKVQLGLYSPRDNFIYKINLKTKECSQNSKSNRLVSLDGGWKLPWKQNVVFFFENLPAPNLQTTIRILIETSDYMHKYVFDNTLVSNRFYYPLKDGYLFNDIHYTQVQTYYYDDVWQDANDSIDNPSNTLVPIESNNGPSISGAILRDQSITSKKIKKNSINSHHIVGNAIIPSHLDAEKFLNFSVHNFKRDYNVMELQYGPGDPYVGNAYTDAGIDYTLHYFTSVAGVRMGYGNNTVHTRTRQITNASSDQSTKYLAFDYVTNQNSVRITWTRLGQNHTVYSSIMQLTDGSNTQYETEATRITGVHTDTSGKFPPGSGKDPDNKDQSLARFDGIHTKHIECGVLSITNKQYEFDGSKNSDGRPIERYSGLEDNQKRSANFFVHETTDDFYLGIFGLKGDQKQRCFFMPEVIGGIQNDYADLYPLDVKHDIKIGYHYSLKDGIPYLTTGIFDKHRIGITTDSYGIFAGNRSVSHIPFCTAGFVNVYYDGKVSSGDVLTNSKDGKLKKRFLFGDKICRVIKIVDEDKKLCEVFIL